MLHIIYICPKRPNILWTGYISLWVLHIYRFAACACWPHLTTSSISEQCARVWVCLGCLCSHKCRMWSTDRHTRSCIHALLGWCLVLFVSEVYSLEAISILHTNNYNVPLVTQIIHCMGPNILYINAWSCGILWYGNGMAWPGRAYVFNRLWQQRTTSTTKEAANLMIDGFTN